MSRGVPFRMFRLATLTVPAIGVALSATTPMAAAAASPTVYTIGVDNLNPPGHDFEYVDFFPRQGVSVSPNDVLDFRWNTATLDGAHTVSFLPRGASVPPLAIPEAATDEPALQFNPDILAPSNPTCGTSKSTPCVFDGTSVVNSGFIANANPTPPYFSDFYVKLDSALLKGAGSVDINYLCQIHPGMVGSLTLVSDGQSASDVASVQSSAAKQYQDDTAGALHAEKSDSQPLVQREPTGTARVTAIAGTATPYVEVVEMLPSTLTIHAGDTVTWVTKTIKDPHTVTFPRGPASLSIDPLPPACEGTSGDTPPNADGPPCANPADFELHLVPQPQGTTMISSPSTLGTSGVIGNEPPFPASYSFTFASKGAFDYQCRIHDNMVGLVVVQ